MNRPDCLYPRIPSYRADAFFHPYGVLRKIKIWFDARIIKMILIVNKNPEPSGACSVRQRQGAKKSLTTESRRSISGADIDIHYQYDADREGVA
jgi:hypothetical protein